MTNQHPLSESHSELTLGAIRLSKHAVAEMQDGRPVVEIARADVERLAVAKGPQAERPILQVLFGSVLIVIGIYALLFVLDWFRFGGLAHDFQFLLTLLLPLGGWILWDGLRSAPLLEVQTKSGVRKLRFGSRISQQDLRAFAERVRAEFDYPISA